MSNQYIIKFKSNLSDELIESTATLSKTNYNIPILQIRNSENKLLFNQYITCNFAKINYNDNDLECIITQFNYEYIIKFDNNSSSSFTDFKTQLTTLSNTKIETLFYESGNIKYIGDILINEEKIYNGSGILYYDIPNQIKYVGEFENNKPDGAGIFYNKSGNIKLKTNNISYGIPTQKGTLEINTKYLQQTAFVNFFDIWSELNIYSNTNKLALVNSDIFIDKLAMKIFDFGELSFEDLCFHEKSIDDKVMDLRNLVIIIQKDILYNQDYMKKSFVFADNMLFAIGISIFINICFTFFLFN